jgi:type II secretory pathway predicted ATPase ExeA
MVSMRAEVMGFYGLTRSPRAVGYFETTHHRQLLQDIKRAVYDGDLVALCGVVGAGKTVMLRRLQDLLARENRVIVAESISVEKSRATLGTLITALFCDLSPDKEPKRLTENESSDFRRLWHDGCGETIIEAQDVDRNHSAEV